MTDSSVKTETAERSAGHRSAQLTFVFSSIGHFFFHYLAAMYFTIVISLAVAWDRPFHELIELWTPAALLIGLAALPAGRLADTWSAPGMMIIMFLGMGAATAACAFAGGDLSLLILLGLIGLFGAIYHPVGISWLIRESDSHTGKKLAINGVFGGLGAAAAGGFTGLLLKFFDWQLAFLIPGVICTVTGLAMLWCLVTGRLSDGAAVTDGPDAASTTDQRKSVTGSGNLQAFLLLLFPMFCLGLVYNTMQAGLPKLFEEGLVGLLDGDLAAVGGMVAAVYIVGAVMQLAGGYLADRYSLKSVYLLCWALQVPVLVLIALSGNIILFTAAMFITVLNNASLPAENMMLARFTPQTHHGVAFGVKYVLAFGAGPLGVFLIAQVREATNSFTPLILGLSVLAALAAISIFLLPGSARTSEQAEARPAPAE